jgi:hypothetical protein
MLAARAESVLLHLTTAFDSAPLSQPAHLHLESTLAGDEQLQI